MTPENQTHISLRCHGSDSAPGVPNTGAFARSISSIAGIYPQPNSAADICTRCRVHRRTLFIFRHSTFTRGISLCSHAIPPLNTLPPSPSSSRRASCQLQVWQRTSHERDGTKPLATSHKPNGAQDYRHVHSQKGVLSNDTPR